MATAAVGIAEYLSTVYDPDCDYVDGEILERNLGAFDHARLQGAPLHAFTPSRDPFAGWIRKTRSTHKHDSKR
jgi:hypothetical protein